MTTNNTPPRPVVTHEMKLAAAEKVLAMLDDDICTAEDLASTYRLHMDGFELCMQLSKAGCDMQREHLDAMEDMGAHVREALRQAEFQWAQEHNIQPPHPIGTHVRCRTGFNRSSPGTITGVYEYQAACYLVQEDGDKDSTRRLIVKFEDATVLEADAE